MPALSGLACPHWDRSAAGLWIGMDAATGREDLVKAVLEGVAFRIAEVLDALGVRARRRPLGRRRPDALALFPQFLASVLGRELFLPETAKITALGAARLAARGGWRRAARHCASRRQSGEAGWREAFAEARRRSMGWRA